MQDNDDDINQFADDQGADQGDSQQPVDDGSGGGGIQQPPAAQIIYAPGDGGGGGGSDGGGGGFGPGSWGPIQSGALQTSGTPVTPATTQQTAAQQNAGASQPLSQAQHDAVAAAITSDISHGGSYTAPLQQSRIAPASVINRRHRFDGLYFVNDKILNMPDNTIPPGAPGAPGANKDTIIINNENKDSGGKGHEHGNKEPGGLHIHPVSVEARHLTIGALIGLVIGLFVGYFEQNRKAGAGWGTIAGFAIGGLLLGLGLAFAMPARKRHEHKHADGKTEVYYTD